MSTLSKVDPSTLGWVKAEIDETLKQARLALEAYTENTADESKLRFCATYLHQVLGTLQMVELDGAAMLARETEALAESVLNGQVAADAPVIETLIRGILTLPDYLARLQFGQPDAPLRVLPLLNELRAMRGAEPLNQLDLFQPDLDVRPPPMENAAAKLSEADYALTTRSLRPAFQAILLNWLRDTGNRRYLDELSTLIERLQQQSPLALIEQLFWVSRGYLDALASGAVAINNDRKRLLARLEQQLKKIAINSDRSLLRNTSEALIKSMLFEVGQAHSATRHAAEVRRAFALEDLLPGSEENYDLPTPEAMQSVAEALSQDIGQAQDQMSSYFEQGDATILEPLITLLHKMSATLEMLNVDVLKALVDEIAGLCQQLQRGELERSESLSLPMAGGMLLLENSMRDIRTPGLSWKQQVDETTAGLRQLRAGEPARDLTGIEISDASLSESEFKQLVAAVGGEIRVNLGKIEEALETFAAAPEQTGLLEAVPHSLNQIQGALQILGQDRAANLMVGANQLVQSMYDGRIGADNAVLDALAVAVGTVGAYIEGLEHDRPNLELLLVSARTDLASALTGKRPDSGNPEALLANIETNLAAWSANRDDRGVLSVLQQDLRDVAWLADSQKQERLGKLCGQMISLLDMVDSGEVTDEVEATLRQSYDALAALARTQLHSQQLAKAAPRATSKAKADAAMAAAPSAPARNAAIEVEGDEDIIQIFIEDAREMIALINKTLPDWHADVSNRDALLDLRRAFHTLKGSGRMVGASEIAEFGWSLENMLNRVREGKVAPSEAMFDLLYKARDVLPEMVVQLEGGPATDADIAELQAQAEALADNRPIESAASSKTHMPPLTDTSSLAKTPAIPAPVADLPSLDATLLQIFSIETREHTENVRSEIEKCRTNEIGRQVSEGLARAAHTLQGSARAVGLKPMAEASAEIEKLLHVYQAHQHPLDETASALFERLIVAVERLIDVLGRGETQAASLLNEFSSIVREAHALQTQMSGTEPAAPSVKPHAPGADAHASMPVSPVPVTVSTSAPAPARDAGETVEENLDPELLEIFLDEGTDIMASIEESLTKWRSDRTDRASVAELKRQLHTLKGGARMAGAMTMGDLGHHTESLLGEVESGRVHADTGMMDLLDEVHDALVTMIDQMQNHKPVSVFAATTAKVLARLGLEPAVRTPSVLVPVDRRLETVANDAPAALEPVEPAALEPVVSHVAPAAVVEAREADIARRTEAEEATEGTGTDRRGQVRVRTALLNELVNYAGEVSISRSRMEQQIFGLRENLAELNRNTTRFRDQIRELEIQSESQIMARAQEFASQLGEDFDPLELDRFSSLQTLSRSLAESLHDLFTIRSNLENYASQAETVLIQQARINTELQEGLMRTRMISFATQGARLRHIVRQTARELGKRVELDLIGAEVEVDRTVLDRMIGPFEHMIRNALDHGLESEAERKRAGKSEIGHIRIQASHEGSEIVLRFADDGAGLDIAAIRRKAIERGLMNASTNLSDDELIQFILVAGFSTANKVTQLSGRGVGMDVVHNEVKQLGGSITVDTRRGVGTSFIIRLPLTLSISQALMVRVSEQLYAIPLSSVVNILEVPVDQLNSIQMGRRPLLNWQDQVYPFMHLAVRLGIQPQPPAGRKVPVLLGRSGGRQVAIQVDGLAGTREVVIKPLGAQLAGIEGLGGATILGDGSVVLILDVPGLWLTEEGMHIVRDLQGEEMIGSAGQKGAEPPIAAEIEAPAPVRRNAVVMVVDDSITVRKVTQRHLLKRGIDVLLAKDGVDAVEQLRDQVPDVMLVDIEMPRMDGYELTSRVRSDSRLKQVPIIMITSRAGDKHRDKALALGVNEYMTKPYQEDELFARINSLLPAHLAL